MKYDFSLDMATDNSNSLIIRNINPNSTVLEFGCAHGRMTKYLKENLGCKVYIVEKDFHAGMTAFSFAEDGWVGEKGDIELFTWSKDLFLKNALSKTQNKFNYIIFADVLEHLIDPWKVLKECISFLEDAGSIFISVPNVAHNAVLIDLLNNKFNYREIGLLDNTHLRFFTVNSLEDMVYSAGLKIVNRLDPKNVVENTEFKNSYNDVPSEVAEYLKSREHGEVYQFVWELKK